MMLHVLTLALSIFSFTTISAQSRNCLDDLDLEDVQSYTYSIPNSDKKKNLHYWNSTQLNYYAFGKFDDSTSDEETTISAGLYNGDHLIYSTEINCDKGTWVNKVLNKSFKKEILLHGKVDANLTSCKAGEPFDLIFKVNNFYAMSWIFNAQPLQHDVRQWDKILGRKIIEGRPVKKEDVRRPAVRVLSKYNAYQATRFVLKATGRARFDRFVFGQCNAWPKGMENQCQNVRSWVHARSKANLTDETMEDHLADFPLDVNITNGLGVFGNNRIDHNPRCLTNKYFEFYQPLVHPDRRIPKELKSVRSYCCCTDMRTGQIFENNPDKYCHFLSVCEDEEISCHAAYNPEVGEEIEEELERLAGPDTILASVLTVGNTNVETGVHGRPNREKIDKDKIDKDKDWFSGLIEEE